MAFRVGQKVVCVDNDWGKYGNPGCKYTPAERDPAFFQLKVGGVYTIRGFYVGNIPHWQDRWHGPSLYLSEIKRSISACGVEAPYAAARFRPLVEDRDQLEVFRSILNDPDKEIPDDQFDKKTKRKKTKEFTESTN